MEKCLMYIFLTTKNDLNSNGKNIENGGNKNSKCVAEKIKYKMRQFSHLFVLIYSNVNFTR